MSFQFNRYIDYLKNKYGTRIQKITVDAGFTCPNRDGSKAYGGCTYCNNDSFAPTHLQKKGIKSVTEQLEHGISIAKRRYKKVSKYIAYFQSYSNTYGDLDHLLRLYKEAIDYPEVIGLAIGTRPDCVDIQKLMAFEELTKSKAIDFTIEYGLESISNDTLKRINRGHSFEEFCEAVLLTKKFAPSLKIGTHIILGFPWEDRTHWNQTALSLSGLPIDFLKIHQLHIVKNTKMGSDYIKSPFPLLSLSDYKEILVSFMERLDKNIIIQRLLGEAPPDILLSPSFHIPESEFANQFNELLLKRGSYQGKFYSK